MQRDYFTPAAAEEMAKAIQRAILRHSETLIPILDFVNELEVDGKVVARDVIMLGFTDVVPDGAVGHDFGNLICYIDKSVAALITPDSKIALDSDGYFRLSA